ncbi:LysR family transcriptional regulator [Roseibium sp.]|uniref:LysR family transcriptional regulator n=1 Tax=Roseibium sp. TaxID=1936156 RepID=UPI003B5011D7
MKKIEQLALNSDLLRAFVTIAEQGHLTLASERLHRTQSALSVQLKKLETGLNATLFERHPKGMKLTLDGEKLLPIAQGILADLYRAQSLFEHPLRGKVRVGIPDHYDDLIFEKVLSDFGKSYPLLDMFVQSGCSGGFPAAINEGRLDVAVVAAPEPGPHEILEIEATLWAESETFDCDPDEPVPLAVLDRGCFWSKLPIVALSNQERSFNVKFKSESFSNLRCAIRAGLAIGVLPARAVQSGMRVSEPGRNLPRLPAMTRSLLVSPDAPADITGAIATALRKGLVENSSRV